MSRAISCICDCVCVSLCVRALKRKRPELLTPNLVHIHVYSVAGLQHALTLRSKIKVTSLTWLCCWLGNACRYDCLCFYSVVLSSLNDAGDKCKSPVQPPPSPKSNADSTTTRLTVFGELLNSCSSSSLSSSAGFIISHHFTASQLRGVDPYGTGGHVPPIFMKGDIHGNVPQYFRSDVV